MCTVIPDSAVMLVVAGHVVAPLHNLVNREESPVNREQHPLSIMASWQEVELWADKVAIPPMRLQRLLGLL